MLVLITSIYCGIVWLLVKKLKILPWTKPTKIGVTVVGVAFILAILILLRLGAPATSGGVTVTGRVIEISSRISGRVTEVHVQPNVPVRRGDPLFQVDPVPYQIEVQRLEAKLVETREDVKQLKALVDAATATVEDLTSRLAQAERDRDRSQELADAAVETSAASVENLEQQLVLARADLERNQAQVDASVGSARANVTNVAAELHMATLERDRNRDLLARNTISQQEFDISETRVESLTAKLQSAKDALETAVLNGRQQTDTRETNVRSLEAQLAGPTAPRSKERTRA
ncbi:MAG: HlyD family secretion protein [Planctomycetota bacterium]|jgi:multidrug resistance efflux pump